MDSDEHLLLTRSCFSQERLLPNSIIGLIVDSILNNADLGQQNSERNVVDQSRGTEKLHWKSSIFDNEELGMRKESRLKELHTVIFLFIIHLVSAPLFPATLSSPPQTFR